MSMSRVKSSWRRLRLVAALAALVPAGVRASTLGVLKKFRWSSPRSRNSSGDLFPRLLVDRIDTPQRGVSRESAREIVERGQQKVGSAVLQGTWVQTVKDSEGRVLFSTGESFERVPAHLEEQVAELETRRAKILAVIRSQVPELSQASRLFAPEIEVIVRDGVAELNWLVDFVDATETRALQVRARSNGALIGVKETGSHLSSGLANVYPRGPKRSAVSEVALVDLDGSGALASILAAVTPATGQAAQSNDLDFRFDPTDDRFDQVQAFFFADQTLSWFKKQFDAQPRSQLQIRVRVGNRSNTAFYMRDTIRLGAGDGVRYLGLARDPSIVMHEVGHSIVDRYAGLPSDGEGGSLNEAFADFFAASILNNPAMGEASYLAGPYVRTLENAASAPADLGHGLYKDSQVFSGALWSLRQIFGPEKGELLAFRTLCRLGAGSKFSDFAPSMKAAAETVLDKDSQNNVEELMRTRGLL